MSSLNEVWNSANLTASSPAPFLDNLSALGTKALAALANRSGSCNLTLAPEPLHNQGCSNSSGSSSSRKDKNWAALLIVIVIILTIGGNTLVIVAVSLEKKLQNATNYFLMSLAIADMLVGILVMPVSLITVLYGYLWPLPVKLCPIWIYFDVLFSTASIMHLCAISLDRYIAIRNPIHHSRFNSRTKAFLKIIAVWTISVGVSMPIPVFGLQDASKVFKDGSCFLTDEHFVLVGSFVAFFIPLTIMVATYFLTIRVLQQEATLYSDELNPKPKWTNFRMFLQKSPLSANSTVKAAMLKKYDSKGTSPQIMSWCSSDNKLGPSGRRSMQSITNEQKASKVLGIVFFLFVVMWCPFFVTNVMSVICIDVCDKELIEELLSIFVWVGYISSGINPLVYTLFNKTYRSAFSRFIHCQYKEEKKPTQQIQVSMVPTLASSKDKLQLSSTESLKHGAKLRSRVPSAETLGDNNQETPQMGTVYIAEKVSYV
ncbi:5-hydroxytryptamine receptor 2A-like [Leucoraja erinacea]|uniref:5-hydroxytryptamine receptor 2A-like n=1 Tax=Leucoraja erinaceus TaxID=7782 RepID=UPI002456989D|nr:5-hydroxytryptamine receptor 2A-like [Leucoraja erinacea]